MHRSGPPTRATRLAPVARRLAALTGTTLLGLGLATAVAVPASGAAVGYVRLAHLSPDTPAVDVYLSAAARATEPRVFKAVGYGVLSQYLPLPAGRYDVAMRKAGAPAGDPPVLTLPGSVAPGAAYTVAGVGRYAELGLKVLDDDLSAPSEGRAKVRVVQASVRAPVIDVAAADGPTIANAVQFATTTPYEEVEPGRWKLRLRPAGATPTMSDVTLRSGTVYSLLVLDAKRGGLTTELRVDARGGTVVPAGGVDTGGGGTADRGGPGRLDSPAGRDGRAYPPAVASVGALFAAGAAAGVLGIRRRRRRRRRRRG